MSSPPPGPAPARRAVLVASYVFYGYWDWRFCSLLLISTVVDFFVGRAIARVRRSARRKRLLWVSCVVNLGILGFFKYFNFFVDSVQEVAAGLGLSVDFLHLNIILPVGISFYTFQTMSYTIDIYRRKLEPTHSLVDFALFVAFFPQLVAGPIERARNLLPQIAVMGRPTRTQVADGLVLLTVGYFKKVLIGDACGRIVDHIFGQPDLYRSPELLAGLILFSIQIYADFSGYSDIARGLAKLLGIELMKNFEQPYLSANITEFWRRWHISLSSWLRDYLYISLGGNRRGNARTYLNLMTTMLLGGLWHGAAWTFVVWGGLHGLYLAVHKMLRTLRVAGPPPLPPDPRPSALGYLRGRTTCCSTWLFFLAAEDFGSGLVLPDRVRPLAGQRARRTLPGDHPELRRHDGAAGFPGVLHGQPRVAVAVAPTGGGRHLHRRHGGRAALHGHQHAHALRVLPVLGGGDLALAGFIFCCSALPVSWPAW